MALPANVGFGTVKGHFVDSSGALIEGDLTFAPSPKRLLNATAEPPTTILPSPVKVSLTEGSFTQTLIATDDEDNNPHGWTYTVSFAFKGAKADPFSFELPEGATVDLTTVSPVSSGNGTMVIRGAGVPEGGDNGQVLTVVAGEPTWADPTGGGGTELTSYVDQVEALDDYPATFPADLSGLADVATTGAYGDLTGTPSIPDSPGDIGAATAAQGALADSAVQPAAIADFITADALTPYALTSSVPTAPGDIGAQPAGSYALTSQLPTDAADVGAEPAITGAAQTVTFTSTDDGDSRPTASSSVCVIWLTTYAGEPTAMAEGDLQFQIGA